MAQKTFPVYKSEEWISKSDFGFRSAMVENREYSKVEHSHDFYEITTVFSGEINHKINGRIYTQKAGDICILRPGDCHLHIRKCEVFKACCFSLTTALIEPFLTAFEVKRRICSAQTGIIFHVHSQQAKSLEQACELMQCYAGQQKKDQGKIIISLILQYYLQFENGQQMDWADRITREMNSPENLAEGVQALQRITNLSHPQLCRVFRRTLSRTPQQFIRELRLNYAYTLISNTSEPLETIAMMVGYSSFSHFSDIFKKQFQQSPSALRKSAIKYW